MASSGADIPAHWLSVAQLRRMGSEVVGRTVVLGGDGHNGPRVGIAARWAPSVLWGRSLECEDADGKLVFSGPAEHLYIEPTRAEALRIACAVEGVEVGERPELPEGWEWDAPGRAHHRDGLVVVDADGVVCWDALGHEAESGPPAVVLACMLDAEMDLERRKAVMDELVREGQAMGLGYGGEVGDE